MKSFEFRLQRVADFRQQQLDVAKNQLEILLAALQQVEAECGTIEQQRSEALRTIESNTSLKGEDVLALATYQGYLSRRETSLKQEKIELTSKVEQQRAAVVQKEREVRLLDRLKDRRLGEWTAAAERELEALAAESYMARLASQRNTAQLRTRNL